MRCRLEEAELLYSHAITVLPTHVMYSNRAMVRLQVPLLPSAPCPKVLVDSGRHGLLTPAHACRHPCSPPLRCSPERTGSLSKLRAVPCPRCGWALQQNKSLESDIMADAALADAEVLPPRAPPPSSRLWIESADSLALTTVAAPVPCAQECIKLDPTFAKGYYRKGTALQDLKKYGPAYDAYKLARASRPQLSANPRAPLADFRKGGGPTLTSPAVCCSGKDQEGQRIRAWAATACRALAADLSLTECPLPYPMPLPRIN